jgi:hypothetical protein
MAGPPGRSREPDKPGVGVPLLKDVPPPVTVPNEALGRRLGIAGIALASGMLLWAAFRWGPEGGEGDEGGAIAAKTSGEPDPDPTKKPDAKQNPPEVKKIETPPTKIETPPTKVETPPTKIDDGGDPTKVEPGKEEPKKVVEKPVRDPNSDFCKQTLDKVKDARTAGNPREMLRHLNAEGGCWKSKAEAAKLRTYAYKELEKWRECARAGAGLSDTEVQKWVKLCERRAATG